MVYNILKIIDAVKRLFSHAQAVTDVHDMAHPEHFAFAVREASGLLD